MRVTTRLAVRLVLIQRLFTTAWQPNACKFTDSLVAPNCLSAPLDKVTHGDIARGKCLDRVDKFGIVTV